jgi:RNA polymerase sigma factor (TIGR02999 family)
VVPFSAGNSLSWNRGSADLIENAGEPQEVTESTVNEVTQLLNAVANGDPNAASQVLPLVYDELRKLAAQKLSHGRSGQTLQPTALVHEAYLRLVGAGPEPHWNGRGHFFAAAAEAMRHILVDSARRKRRAKHGGGRRRVPLDDAVPAAPASADDLLALDEALTRLAAEDPEAAQLVQMRYFAGLSVEEAAESLGMARATAYRHWTFARAWLLEELAGGEPG